MIVLLIIGMLMLVGLFMGAAVFLFQRYANPEPSPIQIRLSQMKANADTIETENMAQIKKLAKFYKEADYKNENLGKRLEQFPIFLEIKSMLQQADMKTPADRFVLNFMLLPIAGCMLLGLMIKQPVLMMAGFMVAGGAYVNVKIKRSKRLGRFTALMPDALSMICSALRAGHSFQSALSVVASEMSDPISTEFGAVVKDINLGIPVKEAMTRLSQKLESLPDVRMFVTAVMIQREAGGNLAEVLDKLGYTIRERFKLKGQISALTGQSRMTGMVLGAAPAAILSFLSIFMYKYVQPLYETDLGHILLGIIVFMQLLGFFVMKKIIDIRV